jgi:hypothetical protein
MSLKLDETEAVKQTAILQKAITSGDEIKALSILDEYGDLISLETRDKNGKTLLMVTKFNV